VHIPSAIGFYAITAQRTEFFEYILPGIGEIAEIVHSTRNELYRSAFFYELIAFDFEGHGQTPFFGIYALIITHMNIKSNIKKESICSPFDSDYWAQLPHGKNPTTKNLFDLLIFVNG
jgi:hypothetical protein